MKLKELLKDIDYEVIQGTDDLDIDNICWDSRKVLPNSLFICTKGKNIDRHIYAASAVNSGACALLIEHHIENMPEDITIIKAYNSRVAMASIANVYYNEPSKKFNLIGITGTNGKTSTSFFLSKLLETLGETSGIIGSIENKVLSTKLKTEKLNPTTPDAIELQASFSEMVKLAASNVVMEVTSSALDNHRVDYCDFDIGIFTNLTQDHLDEHKTMENYKKAKMKLFDKCRLGIINADDPISDEIKHYAKCPVITYGIDKNADFTAEDIKYSISGSSFTLNFLGNKSSVKLNLFGKFNIYNTLASIAACYSLGFPIKSIIEALKEIYGVPGRFQPVPNYKECLIIVDYAHTPDGLENVLSSVKELKFKRLITVFGCGGNRDKLKRPIMGKIAGNLSDYCILTSDNPRMEKPSDILHDIEAGIKQTSCPYEITEDRTKAINKALDKAAKGDAVIIAGKGHEDYQIIGDKVIHFDDVEVIKQYLAKGRI